MNILQSLLNGRGIEPVEAAGALAPGQNVFCAKICSKIIVSQFCAILANNDVRNGVETPNANVLFEYGLMVGFNKYVIPFQREIQTLPFNVAGLDTIKYSNQSFKQKASEAIDAAITATTQQITASLTPDQVLEAWVLSKRMLVVSITAEGDRALFELGRPLGFNLLVTFDGMRYAYLGNFTLLRPETVLWRVRTLEEIIRERLGSLPHRVELGIAKPEPQELLGKVLRELQILLLVTSDGEREAVKQAIAVKPVTLPVHVFSLNDVSSTLRDIG
jgi:hypothetical protein